METVFINPAPRLAVDHMGEGELVVLLHGVGGQRTNWHPNMPALAANFRIAAWDARGYGDSEDVAGPRRMADFRDDLLRVIDHFGAARTHLVGLSMGGRIAAHFHAAWPQRVASLVLCDTHLGFAHFSPEARAAFIAKRRDPLLAGKTPADIAPGLARTMMGDPDNTEALNALVASMSRLRTDSYIRTVIASVEDDQTPLLENVAVPTLVLTGERDRLTPPALAKQVANHIPGSELAIIEGAGHLSNIEAPNDFNRIVGTFLANISTSG
ncbi:MAG: alpha/beta hydrolase [Acuticoccus sp.]